MAERKKRRKRLISRKTEVRLYGILGAVAAAAAVGYGVDRVIQSGILAGKPTIEGEVMIAESTEAAPESVASVVEEKKPMADPNRDRTASNSSPLQNADAIRDSEDEIVTTDLSGDWRLVLVNPTHKLPVDFWVDTRVLMEEDTGKIDERIYSVAMQMLNDCEAAGFTPIIRGAYRTYAQQKELYEEKVRTLMSEGETQEQAELDAATIIALPGTSEHQLGLALDIVSIENAVLNEEQENTPTQKWLMEHSWEYGFVLRYPTDKCEHTGIIYEPWHYRYVGKEAAKIMTEEGLCLEEYLERYGNKGEA